MAFRPQLVACGEELGGGVHPLEARRGRDTRSEAGVESRLVFKMTKRLRPGGDEQAGADRGKGLVRIRQLAARFAGDEEFNAVTFAKDDAVIDVRLANEPCRLDLALHGDVEADELGICMRADDMEGSRRVRLPQQADDVVQAREALVEPDAPRRCTRH